MEDDRGSDVGIGIIISSVTKQAGNNINPTWPFYFEEIFLFTDFFMKLQLILGIECTAIGQGYQLACTDFC